MSSATVTPGIVWSNQSLNYANLNAAANPTVTIPANSIGADELVAADVLEVVGSSVANDNLFRNGDMAGDTWGTASPTTSNGAWTAGPQDWYARPSGAALTSIAKSTTVPTDAVVSHSMAVTGNTSVTATDIGQFIGQARAAALASGNFTVSFYIYNGTGAAISPTLRIDTYDAADDSSAVTNEVDATLTACADSAWTLVETTIDGSTVSNLGNGAILYLRTTALDGSGKSINVAVPKLELSAARTSYKPKTSEPVFLPGMVINSAYGTYSTYEEITSTTLAYDDTVPQITEGVEKLTVTITPRRNGSLVRGRLVIPFATSSSGDLAYLIAAVFRDSTADAIAAQGVGTYTTGILTLDFVDTTGTVAGTDVTYSLRVGRATRNVKLNGGSTAGTFSTTDKTTLILDEVAQ